MLLDWGSGGLCAVDSRIIMSLPVPNFSM